MLLTIIGVIGAALLLVVGFYVVEWMFGGEENTK